MGAERAGIISQSCKRFTGNNNCKNKRYEWILLNIIKDLEKDLVKQRVINHQFKANSESQKNSLVVDFRHSSPEPEGRNSWESGLRFNYKASEGWIHFRGRERERKGNLVRGSFLVAWQWKERRKQVIEIKDTRNKQEPQNRKYIKFTSIPNKAPNIFKMHFATLIKENIKLRNLVSHLSTSLCLQSCYCWSKKI